MPENEKLPDTLAEAQDKEAEAGLKDKGTDPAEKARLAGQILTTAEARHEADLESEQIRQNAQRKFAAEADEAARKAAADEAKGEPSVPDDWKDIRSPEPKK